MCIAIISLVKINNFNFARQESEGKMKLNREKLTLMAAREISKGNLGKEIMHCLHNLCMERAKNMHFPNGWGLAYYKEEHIPEMVYVLAAEFFRWQQGGGT
jgi:hypothetical protein